MLRYYLICIFLCASLYGSSQSIFTFSIFDQKTKEPIPFGYVVVKGSTNSDLTSQEGEAEIKCKGADTLVIYQLGYYLLRTTREAIEREGSVVYLKRKDIALDEVTVTTKLVDTFMYKNDIAFIDFDFYDDHILALVSKSGKYNTLLMLDLNGNKLAEKKLNFDTETIFKDCFDNLHVLGKDSIYQVYYNYQDIILLPPYHIRNYYDFLKPCECIHFNTYIFKQERYRELKNLYYILDGPQKNLLITVADSAAIKDFNLDFDINYFLSLRRRGMGYATSVDELSKHIDQLRETVPLPSNYLLEPVHSEMKKLDSCFVLFDHTNKFVHRFTLNGKTISKQPFTPGFPIGPKLYIDHDTHRYFFAHTSSKGVLTFYRYDPLKNIFTHKFELPAFYFIKNFKARGNTLYFIYKDRSGPTTKTKIFKEVIKWEKL